MMETFPEIHFMVSGGAINDILILSPFYLQMPFGHTCFLNPKNQPQFAGTQSPVATDMHWKSWAWQTGTFVRISGHRKRKADEGEGA